MQMGRGTKEDGQIEMQRRNGWMEKKVGGRGSTEGCRGTAKSIREQPLNTIL